MYFSGEAEPRSTEIRLCAIKERKRKKVQKTSAVRSGGFVTFTPWSQGAHSMAERGRLLLPGPYSRSPTRKRQLSADVEYMVLAVLLATNSHRAGVPYTGGRA